MNTDKIFFIPVQTQEDVLFKISVPKNIRNNLFCNKDGLKLSTNTQHECPICKKVFQKKQYMTAHMIIHSDSRPFNCQVCGNSFKQKAHLQKHMKIHTGERNHVCSYCNKKFKSEYNLKVHLRGHNNERPYKCYLCGQPFRQKAHLIPHFKFHSNTIHTFGKKMTFNSTKPLWRPWS